jgi:hypothetical protein
MGDGRTTKGMKLISHGGTGLGNAKNAAVFNDVLQKNAATADLAETAFVFLARATVYGS